MQVTVHVYPKGTGDPESPDRIDVFIHIDDKVCPWFGVKGFKSRYRISECVEMLRKDHGVEPVVYEHNKAYYYHLPQHESCADATLSVV